MKIILFEISITLTLNRVTNTKNEYDETQGIQLIRLYNPQGVFIQ